jgi:DNA-binding GntR family transcriptional regulator
MKSSTILQNRVMSQREKVYQKIRDAITCGELKPGEQLVESRICEIFHVGRTPLREALRQLQMEGYVDALSNKGAFVRTVSIRDVEEIYSIIGILEAYATELATEHIGTAEKKKLKSIHNDLVRAGLKKDYRKWLEKNGQFHGYFPKLSGNFHMSKVISTLRNRIYRYRFIAITIPGHIEEYIQAHGEILGALFKKDAEKAARAMQSHVFNVKEVLVEFLKQSPGL